jgi:iron complex outermembrane receptor protein
LSTCLTVVKEPCVLNRHRIASAAVMLLALWAVAIPAVAQVRPPPGDLTDVTLEDLMKIEITSAARKVQRADEVPAAVFVITQDAIRRSGLRTLPELFRLAPGVQVAQLTSSSWAVSIRGFNDQFSNKLLVLVDGRSIYTRVFSGVFWDAEDLVLEDIDRIEIIRGPGGAVWGANAVNGVINIVTKTAGNTPGTLVRLSAGTFDRAQATVRHGGSLGSAAYRVYSQWSGRGGTDLANGVAAGDSWTALTNGVRLDWERDHDDFTVHGSARIGDTHATWLLPTTGVPDLAPRTEVDSSYRTGNALARWTHRGVDGSSLQVQSSLGFMRRTDLVSLDETAFDTDLQYRVRPGGRHDLVAGGGYRYIQSKAGTSYPVSFDPSSVGSAVVNVFAQDEMELSSRLHLVVGSKLEHETFTGWGVSPTVRVMWAPGQRHHLWAAASRALRTPALSDLFLRFKAIVVPGEGAPMVIGAVGNPDFKAEALHDVEGGYRLALGANASVDVTVFRGRYSRLPTSEPLAPVFEATPGPPHVFVATQFQNLLTVDTAGMEIAAQVTPLPHWRLEASYSGFSLTPHPDQTSVDPDAALFDGNAPAHQWQVHSSVRVGPRTDVNVQLFRSGPLRRLGVPAYTRADARVEVRLSPRVSAVAGVRNLFDATHAEFVGVTVVSTQIPRSADVQLVWRF